jgi:glycosyltransferase involved in cell wall biosynthesis
MNVNQKNKPLIRRQAGWIAYVSTFPPRRCGIATFTTDLTNAIDKLFGPLIKTKIVAMNLTKTNHPLYLKKVIFHINQSCKNDYIKIAKKLNLLKEIKIVSVQHEFGIFRGDHGSNILLFLKEIKKPVVITFHTVLPAPNKKMCAIVQAIAKYAEGIIVMSHSSKEILKKDYGLNPKKIQVIPHGIHQTPCRTNKHAKSVLGFSGKTILSTFGFLNPNKGIEYVIKSLPKVIKKFPDVLFLVAGITHPAILEKKGETYRNFLLKKVQQLGLNNYVFFYNTYFDLNKILRFLEATDIYLSTSLNPNQAVSGTLSYALGSGRPVISTAFAQAKQDVTKDVGLLVDFKNPTAFTKAIIKLLSNKKLCLQMGKNAYDYTRYMTWENVARAYMEYFSQFSPELILEQKTACHKK